MKNMVKELVLKTKEKVAKVWPWAYAWIAGILPVIICFAAIGVLAVILLAIFLDAGDSVWMLKDQATRILRIVLNFCIAYVVIDTVAFLLRFYLTSNKKRRLK